MWYDNQVSHFITEKEARARVEVGRYFSLSAGLEKHLQLMFKLINNTISTGEKYFYLPIFNTSSTQ